MWIRLGFIYHVWKTVCPLVRVCNESNCLIESNQIKSNRIESNWIESNRIESNQNQSQMKWNANRAWACMVGGWRKTAIDLSKTNIRLFAHLCSILDEFSFGFLVTVVRTLRYACMQSSHGSIPIVLLFQTGVVRSPSTCTDGFAFAAEPLYKQYLEIVKNEKCHVWRETK
jgi:hypothetical protein